MENNYDQIDVSTHGEPNKFLPAGFDPHLHIAVVCARKGINLSKLGRNEPCPCESGKKFKNCCIDQTPEELCYKFSLWDNLFHISNVEGNLEGAEKCAIHHNKILSVLQILDPKTFKSFEPLKAG